MEEVEDGIIVSYSFENAYIKIIQVVLTEALSKWMVSIAILLRFMEKWLCPWEQSWKSETNNETYENNTHFSF